MGCRGEPRQRWRSHLSLWDASIPAREAVQARGLRNCGPRSCKGGVGFGKSACLFACSPWTLCPETCKGGDPHTFDLPLQLGQTATLSDGFTIELCAGIIDKQKSLEEITSEEIQVT